MSCYNIASVGMDYQDVKLNKWLYSSFVREHGSVKNN